MKFIGNIVLASASPRRAELLRQIGLTFDQIAMNVDELADASADTTELAIRNARSKALAAMNVVRNPLDTYVVSADTIVVIDGLVLGKPSHRQDAARMLRLLRKREHSVITGLAVIAAASGSLVSGASHTKVYMNDFSESEIDAYVASGEPMDKAGAYGIQGKAGIFVERIEGSYSNVVGLPLELLRTLFLELGIDNLLAERAGFSGS